MFKCELCQKYCTNIQSLSKHIGTKHKNISKEDYYLQFLKRNTNKYCPICGKITPFLGLDRGYQLHCSPVCAGQNINTKLKREKTNKTIYGTNYNFQNKQFREQAKQTKLKRYGDENYNNRELYKQNYLRKHGVENPYQSKEIKEKIKQTNLKKYGVEVASKSNIVKDKAKATCQKRYGIDWYVQTQDFKDKYKQISLLRYGTENPTQNKKIQEKIKQTTFIKYGVKCVFNRPDIQVKANSKEATQKMNETKHKHRTFNTSTTENKLYEQLINIFNKDDVKRNYKSDVYPFLCDFYIESLDLYIELNAHWTHGGHFFDFNNSDDRVKLEQWKDKAKNSKFYKVAIDVWTNRDVKKKNIAINNKLNYVTLWNNSDINTFLNKFK